MSFTVHKPDITHKWDGPDDGRVTKLLCRGYAKAISQDQAVDQIHSFNSPVTMVPQYNSLTLTMEIKVFGSVNSEALHLLQSGAAEILIRSVE